jgi:DNA polymerase elongation subunit (family B)
MKLVGFDTETVPKNGIQTFHSFQAYSEDVTLPDGGKVFFRTTPGDLKRLFTHKYRGCYFVSANLDFDLSVLGQIFPDIRLKPKVFYSRTSPVKVVFEDRSNHVFTFVDLFNIYPNVNLMEIGKIIGLKKLEKPEYLGQRAPTSSERKSFFNYAMRDAKICYLASRKVLKEFHTIKPTYSSLGLKLFKMYTPNFVDFPNYGSDLREEWRHAYRGGRTECYVRGIKEGKIFYYDFKGMYPHIMANNPFPIMRREFRYSYLVRDNVDLDNEGLALCKVSCEGEKPPLGIKRQVKFKSASNRPKIMEKLIFPEGRFKDWFTYPELRYIELEGYGKIIKVFKSYEWRRKAYIFKSFMEDLTAKREAFKARGSGFEKFIKYLQNSLYGKFGETIRNVNWTLTKEGFKPVEGQGSQIIYPIHNNFVYASYITALARLEVHRKMREIGFNEVLYVDTDSIFTEKVTPLSPLFEKKDEYSRVVFIRGKFYLADDLVICKGLPLSMNIHEAFRRIKEHKILVHRNALLKIREAYRRQVQPLSLTDKSFKINVYEDGKRNYNRHLDGSELLTCFTESKPLKCGR